VLPVPAPPEPVTGPVVERDLSLGLPLELRFSLHSLGRGRRDPSLRFDGRHMWRATRTPMGPAVQHLAVDQGGRHVHLSARGPGAEWLAETLPDLVGQDDGGAEFDALLAKSPGPKPPPGWDLVRGLAHRRPGLRIPRSRAVMEILVPVILGQKVTTIEATRNHRELVTALGEPADPIGGSPPLLLPPDPAIVAATPGWAMHPWGIERKRADTIRRVAAVASRLEETAELPRPDAYRRLMSVPGIGPWTAAEVGLVAYGDPDAVIVGDYHLPNQVAWMLLGKPRGDDDLMLELLEPWRGHRGRVGRLLMASGSTAPKFGPHQQLRSFRYF
jgi:3-methyladenine DNA glycosylase/8-oxoguanine DNA glycosylase